MATANFSQPNLSAVYACEVQDDWSWDDNIENVTSELKQIDGFYTEDQWLDRNIKAIGAIYIDVYNWEYREWEEKPIYITVESGYYSGMMFDVDYSNIYDSYEIRETKSLENKIGKVCRAVEKVLEQYTTPLLKVAQFSNGEAIYAPANSTRAQIKSALLN